MHHQLFVLKLKMNALSICVVAFDTLAVVQSKSLVVIFLESNVPLHCLIP